MMKKYEDFGALLKELRKEKGVSLRLLGEISGVSYRHIHDIEHGKKDVRLSTMIEQLSCFGKHIDIK